MHLIGYPLRCVFGLIIISDLGSISLLETVGATLNELPWFLAYMATAVGLTLCYVVIYIWVSPLPEFLLIGDMKCVV